MTTYEFTQIDIPLLLNTPYTVVDGQVTHYGYLPQLSNMTMPAPNEIAGVAWYTGPGQVGTNSWLTDTAGTVTLGPVPAALHGGGEASPSLNGLNTLGEVTINGVLQYGASLNGTFEVVADPNAAIGAAGSLGGQPQQANYTTAVAVNDAGVVVGGYYDTSNALHGFVDDHGTYTEIDVPGATSTSVDGIDDHGDILGTYTDAAGAQHMFVGEVGQYAAIGTPINASFSETDTTTGVSSMQSGAAYVGPVAGLTSAFISTSADNLNITAVTPNSFIHTGSGEDAIDVSKAGGNNVLDGGTGSNFLVGGSGTDTFFVDDRGASTNVWSTIGNLHAGDQATVWGVTANDFQISMVNGKGASGYTGLTINATEAGDPNVAAVTLAGFSQADLSSGKVSLSYGRTADTPGLAGSDYMAISIH
jgi:hypothetical protein